MLCTHPAPRTRCMEISKTWLVDFNPKKTKALIISNNTNIPELNIRFNDESVELVDNHKHLGVTFVSDGNWTAHIENIARSALKQKMFFVN